MELQHSRFYALHKCQNQKIRSLTCKSSYNISNVFLTKWSNGAYHRKKVYISKVWFPAGRIRVTEEPNNGETGLVLPYCSCVATK